jgi:hypothetical protein
MSLPGLELAEASVETQHAPAPPTQVNLRAGSEWRFEVTFGATVRVKVCLTLFLAGENHWYCSPWLFFDPVAFVMRRGRLRSVLRLMAREIPCKTHG